MKLQDSTIIGMIPPNNAVGKLLSKSFPPVVTLVWVDASKRPDIRDLGRVHATEGEGEGIFTWMYIDETGPESYFVLNVDLQKPVRVSFRLPIRMIEWSAIVEVVSRTGSLSIVPGPPIKWREMLKTMKPEDMLLKAYEKAGADTTITMNKETIRELRQHYEAWKASHNG